MKLSLIVAMDRNGLIGRDGGLPWPRIPEDMRHFRRLTTGGVVVMGRKTWESVGFLPGRENMVLSSSPVSDHRVWERVTRESAVRGLETWAPDRNAFVVGGAQVYAAFRDLVSEAHVTLIDGEFEGDTYFPFPLLGSPEWTPLAEPETLAPGVVHHHLGRVGR